MALNVQVCDCTARKNINRFRVQVDLPISTLHALFVKIAHKVGIPENEIGMSVWILSFVFLG